MHSITEVQSLGSRGVFCFGVSGVMLYEIDICTAFGCAASAG